MLVSCFGRFTSLALDWPAGFTTSKKPARSGDRARLAFNHSPRDASLLMLKDGTLKCVLFVPWKRLSASSVLVNEAFACLDSRGSKQRHIVTALKQSHSQPYNHVDDKSNSHSPYSPYCSFSFLSLIFPTTYSDSLLLLSFCSTLFPLSSLTSSSTSSHLSITSSSLIASFLHYLLTSLKLLRHLPLAVSLTERHLTNCLRWSDQRPVRSIPNSNTYHQQQQP